ncbi:DUF4395 domain-containing protein [uncultured Lutibacter sp.]|uniref:DUF4395 domain-containing protein n=1 Tax=uncultured Lutibacter sp. TaxID=437739 RepID=UPI002615DF88|nr:DUF4395 domain-containing protein [uncultured Lutibacter sp.]
MSILSFGDYIEGRKYKVLDERQLRASAGIMLLLGIIASINGFILNKYTVIPYISGFLLLNFLIGIFINPKYAPTMLLAKLIVYKQSPLPIGAIQKKFAWSLGLVLSTVIFSLSLFLINDATFFDPVCLLCLICLVLLYLEAAFGICVGCKLYDLAINLNLLKNPTEKPNCMGDSCEV